MEEYVLEERALQALNTLSLHDQLRNWEDHMNRPATLPLKSTHATARIRQRSYRISSQQGSSHAIRHTTFKTPLVPKKVKFQEKPMVSRQLARIRPFMEVRKKTTVHQGLTITGPSYFDAQLDMQEGQSINLMKYWFRHRLKENSINNLIGRIQEKRRCLREGYQ